DGRACQGARTRGGGIQGDRRHPARCGADHAGRGQGHAGPVAAGPAAAPAGTERLSRLSAPRAGGPRRALHHGRGAHHQPHPFLSRVPPFRSFPLRCAARAQGAGRAAAAAAMVGRLLERRGSLYPGNVPAGRKPRRRQMGAGGRCPAAGDRHLAPGGRRYPAGLLPGGGDEGSAAHIPRPVDGGGRGRPADDGRRARAGQRAGAEPVRRMADQAPLRRHLLPQRHDLLRRPGEGGAGAAVGGSASAGRNALHRPQRAAGRGSADAGAAMRAHHLPQSGRPPM
ncbi:MAG: Chemotaxis protein methyltransferase CheR, partial [uncultured Sphingomonas sp.]